VNGKVAKPSYRVKVGDKIKVRLGRWMLEYEVVDVPPNKRISHDYVKLISKEEVSQEW